MVMAPDVRELVPPTQRGTRPGPAPATGLPTVAGAADLPTPVLTVDTQVVRRLHGALRSALPGVDLHYAVKANPSTAVLATLAAGGARWDVASPGEIDAVLDVDPDPSHLSYGNTAKKASDIAYATSVGVRRFSFDSDAELDKLARHAPGATLMVRLETSGQGADWALGRKFGCSEREAARLMARAASLGHPVGVCFHVGSQQHDVHAWDAPLAATARLRSSIRRFGTDIAVVDLGGGFPGTAAEPTPHIDDFGVGILGAVRRHLGPTPPPLMAEPGRFLVADAGVLETEVVLVAERDGMRWVHLDVGLFSGLAETMGEALRYRISAHRDGEELTGPVEEAVLAGPTCDSVDVLYLRHRPSLPTDLRPGDRLRLHGTGAYTTTYSSVGFNGFAPLRELAR
jgi:ornithine decarboxylase